MLRRALCLAAICLCLNGCSYVYEVLAFVRGGQLVFAADEDCVSMVEVRADGGEVARAGPGDDLTRVGYGTFWYQHVEFADRCKNGFPLIYGVALEGSLTSSLGVVTAKPLLREVIYTVSTSTGSTGHGGGRFMIRADGTVENVS